MLVLNLLNYRFTCQDPGCQGCYAPEAPALTSGALTGNNQSGRLSTGMYLYQPLIHRPQLCCWLPFQENKSTGSFAAGFLFKKTKAPVPRC